MKIKTNALTGRVLDWAVCLAIGGTVNEGNTEVVAPNSGYYLLSNGRGNFTPSSDWSICGQLIEAFKIKSQHSVHIWYASCKRGMLALGRTPQIAICRAVVAAQLGDEVEIPDELEGV
ncbi:phage protein NinX family protein [Xenorhabdus nematophila]|uniref:phage protein NinX family protein n=1 Tax=Xenorhabdus nematophila TaxID=628 RepID=UPI0032B7323B